MPINSLNKLAPLRKFVTGLRRKWITRVTGVEFADNVSVSLTAQFSSRSRGAIVISPHTLIAFKSMIRTTRSDGSEGPVHIKENCFIGGGSLILPGVTVGPNAIVGAGAVVFDDVPPYSIAAGNPARIIATDIEVGPYGRFLDAGPNR